MNWLAAPNFFWLSLVAIGVVLLVALTLLMGSTVIPALSAALMFAAGTLVLAVLGLCRELSRKSRALRNLEQQLQTEQRQSARVSAILLNSDHRLGNDLATVSSLLALQALRTQHPEARQTLDAARTRIHAVASAHRRLRLGDDLETANLGEFLTGLLEDLAPGNGFGVQLIGDFDSIAIDPRHATTLGLLIGELVSNALAHGYTEQQRGTVRVSLKRDAAGIPILQVSDDGTGPGDADPRNTGFGSLVIKQLATQLGGEPTSGRLPAGGFQISMKLPLLLAASRTYP